MGLVSALLVHCDRVERARMLGPGSLGVPVVLRGDTVQRPMSVWIPVFADLLILG